MSFFCRAGSVVARISTARRPALAAPAAPMASVPTGMPFGICTMESRESKPCSAVAAMGTPSTGRTVGRDHAGQVRRAARAGDDDAQAASDGGVRVIEEQSGVRCAETTRASCGTPNSRSISTAAR